MCSGSVSSHANKGGIVQVSLLGDELQTTSYPDTAGFVDAQTTLLRGDNELYAVNAHEIVRLRWRNIFNMSVGIAVLNLAERQRQEAAYKQALQAASARSPEEIAKASAEERDRFWKAIPAAEILA